MIQDLEQARCSLETLIWQLTPEQLRALEGMLSAILVPEGRLADLLAGMSDETLALAVRKNFFRRAAFEEWLVNRYEKWLLRYFVWKTGDQHQAADLVQEIYVKFLDGVTAGRFDPTLCFCPYLKTVAHHLWAEKVRRQRFFSALVEEQCQSEPPPEEMASFQETEKHVESALEQLPEQQREVLGASMRGETADEIARQLQIPKRKVYNLLFRARRFVERVLACETGQASR